MILWRTFFLLMAHSSMSLSSSCIDASKWVNVLGGHRVEVSNQNFESSTVSFSCEEGFYLIGPSKLNCHRGVLNGSLPLCAMDIGANGIPSQSSGNSPYYAINTDLMTCSQTLETDQSPWWILDLLEVIEISAIQLVLTHHSFDQIMVESMEVRIGNSSNFRDNPICAFLVQDDKEVNENDTVVIPCAGVKGRYVSLNSVNTEPRFLILCKVLVLVVPSQYIHPKQCLSTNEGHLYHQRLTRFKINHGRCIIWRRGRMSTYLQASDFCEKRGLRLPLTSSDLNPSNVRDSVLVRWLSRHFEYKNTPRAFTWVSVRESRLESDTTTGKPEILLDCWALDTNNAWKWSLRPCESKAHTVCVSDPKRCVSPDVKFGTRIKKPHSFWIENKRPWVSGTIISYECINTSQVIDPNQSHKRICGESGHWLQPAPTCVTDSFHRHPGHELSSSSSLLDEHSLFKDHFPASNPSLARDVEIEIQGTEDEHVNEEGRTREESLFDDPLSPFAYDDDYQESPYPCEVDLVNGTCSSYLHGEGRSSSHLSSRASTVYLYYYYLSTNPVNIFTLFIIFSSKYLL